MSTTRRAWLACAAPMLLPSQSGIFANGEAYERFMGRWSRIVAPRLFRFAAMNAAAEHILDIGSGTGAMAFTIAAERPRVRVTGVDPSADFVAFAASKNTFGPRVKFDRGDAQTLPYEAGAFSASIGLLVFNFIPDPARALREARRVTKTGGVVATAVWDYGGRMEMLRAFWDAVVQLDPAAEKLDEQHMRLCREGELRQLWSDGGLTQVVETPLDIEMRFASFDDYWAPFLLGQAPAGSYVRKLDDQRKQALRKALVTRLKVRSENAELRLPARVHAVRGIVPPA